MQHLNLYSQLDHIVEPPYSSRHLILSVVAVFVVILLAAAWLAVDSSAQSSRLEPLLSQQQAVSAELEVLRAQKTRLENDNSDDTRIAALKNDIQFRRQLLGTLEPDAIPAEDGFSEHLRGLARQSVEGMWFTGFSLQDGGGSLSLAGRANSPELVPRFLKKLASEPVYRGHHFRLFKMNAAETGGPLLEFEITAQDVEE